MKKHNATKTVLLIFLFLSTVSAANAASFVIGRIYLKNGLSRNLVGIRI